MKIQLEVHGEGTSRLPRIRTMLDYGGNDPGVKVCWYSNPTVLLDGGFDANVRPSNFVGVSAPSSDHLARFVQEARAASALNNVDAVTAGGESAVHV